MIRARWFYRLGFLLLAAAFACGCWRLVKRTRPGRAGGPITLTFAHWQLEGTTRQAFDALARDYEKLHPDIRIEQLAIPLSVYSSWGTTHVVGGVAPDLVELGRNLGGRRILPYFLPITDEINRPNPYNAGTPLAGVAWRNTFVDGMEAAFDPQSFDCYGASVFANTFRIYYNADLLREITGQAEPPRTFEQFTDLCRQVRAFAARTGRPVLPFAGSRIEAPLLMDDLATGQLQRLTSRLNPGVYFPVGYGDFFLSYLNHEWTLDDPAMRSAIELIRRVGAEMPDNFMQYGRDDSLFYFVQGRALMMAGYAQDGTSISSQAPFPVRVFKNPAPRPQDREFGGNMVGPNAERLSSYGAFGIARASLHPQEALDFLQFLTSFAADQKFVRISGFLPVLVGIQATGLTRDFMPSSRGFPPGPYPVFLFTNTGQVIQRLEYLMIGPEADQAAFFAALKRELPGAMREEVSGGLRNLIQTLQLNDTAIEAVHQLQRADPANLSLQRKYQGMVETQNEQEATAYYTELRLRRAARLPLP